LDRFSCERTKYQLRQARDSRPKVRPKSGGPREPEQASPRAGRVPFRERWDSYSGVKTRLGPKKRIRGGVLTVSPKVGKGRRCCQFGRSIVCRCRPLSGFGPTIIASAIVGRVFFLSPNTRPAEGQAILLFYGATYARPRQQSRSKAKAPAGLTKGERTVRTKPGFQPPVFPSPKDLRPLTRRLLRTSPSKLISPLPANDPGPPPPPHGVLFHVETPPVAITPRATSLATFFSTPLFSGPDPV